MENLLKSDLEDIVADVQDIVDDPELSDSEKLVEIEDIVNPKSEGEDFSDEE